MVYFILHKKYNCIKIGATDDLDKRLTQLRCSTPVWDDLKLLFWVDGGKELERELHREWHAYRRDGEWFDYSGDFKEVVDATIRTIPASGRGIVVDGEIRQT